MATLRVTHSFWGKTKKPRCGVGTAAEGKRPLEAMGQVTGIFFGTAVLVNWLLGGARVGLLFLDLAGNELYLSAFIADGHEANRGFLK